MYTIKSTSEEGIFYLVNGWNKYKSCWVSEKSVLEDKKNRNKVFFNKPTQAKASLTKLLKVMPEYAADKFELIEVTAI